MEREYFTVPWMDLPSIQELRPPVKVPYKPKQGKSFLAELSIASVNGIDAEGGSKSDNKSNKFDTTGFLHDTSPTSYDGRVLLFEPLFKEASFGCWVQMEVKVTESDSGTTYYPVGEVWIGRGKKPKNPYKLSKPSSSPPTCESTPSHNSSTSTTGSNPNYCPTIRPSLTNTKPLRGVTIESDIASAPALPPPKHWQGTKPYSVVFNTVFEELERQRVVLRKTCHPVTVEECHLQQEYQWIRPNNILWCIPVTDDEIKLATGYTLAYAGQFRSLQYRLFMNQSPTRCTNEAMCVTSMMKINGNMGPPKILGYNNERYYDTWTNFNGIDYNGNANLADFATRIIDQDGRITTIITPTAL